MFKWASGQLKGLNSCTAETRVSRNGSLRAPLSQKEVLIYPLLSLFPYSIKVRQIYWFVDMTGDVSGKCICIYGYIPKDGTAPACDKHGAKFRHYIVVEATPNPILQ